MKKFISFMLAAVLLVSAVPTALATNDYSAGTKVEYVATGSESYTITVPAQLAPGGNGAVTLSGTWADNRVVTVTADPTVTLTNSIKADDQKVLDVTFAGISEAGSNTGSQTFTEDVSVAEIENALFGTWSGRFNYNVEIATVASAHVLDGDGQTFHKMAPSALSFRSTAPLDEFQEVKVNGVTVDPSNYTLTEGSTIVTLSIDYLKTLDATTHQITVVSESGSPSAGFRVVEPKLNEYGFYYNQAYSATLSGKYKDMMGTETNLAPTYVTFTIANTNSGYYKIGNFFGEANVSCDDGVYTIDMMPNPAGTLAFTLSGTFSSDGKTFNCTGCTVKVNGMNLGELTGGGNIITGFVNIYPITFSIDKDKAASDGNVLYVYDETSRKNIAYVIDTRANQIVIQDGINGFETFQIGAWNYASCQNLTSIVIPNSITSIGASAFYKCTELETIYYEGTVEQWNAITKGDGYNAWNTGIPATEVICSDGTVSLS